MTITRRTAILGIAGGSAVLLGGAAYWRVSQLPSTASAPWTLASNQPDDVRLDAFRHAILAPNPHNRQPWLIKLEGADSALLSCDLAKRLPATDPFDRQITIGFGSFIELARIAAAERGHAIDATTFPEGEPGERLDARPVARLVFRRDGGVARDPLYRHILDRRTNRALYDRAPSAAMLAAVAREGVSGSAAPGLLAPLRVLTVDAITTELRTPRTWQESLDVMRIGHAEIDANPDGLALSGPMAEIGGMAGVLTREALADPASTAFETGLEQQRAAYGSVPAVAWITTTGNRRADQLEAGRRYVRANLRAAGLGLAMHPMSQALQEYAEVAPAFARLHALLGARDGERVQMLARIGHAPPVGPAARWPLDRHMIA